MFQSQGGCVSVTTQPPTVEQYKSVNLIYSIYSFIGNIFTHNRAAGQVAGKNGGGGMCISKASALLLDNTFSHNTAAGDAGALRVDDCDIVTIDRSKFSNNAAQGNGGVIHTYYFSTNYTITHSSFVNNQAGGDGGVMYV